MTFTSHHLSLNLGQLTSTSFTAVLLEHFGRSKQRQRVKAYLQTLLSPVERENCYLPCLS